MLPSVVFQGVIRIGSKLSIFRLQNAEFSMKNKVFWGLLLLQKSMYFGILLMDCH